MIAAEVPAAERATTRGDEFRSWLTALLGTGDPLAAAEVMAMALAAGFSKKTVNTASKEMVDEKSLRKRLVPPDGLVPGQWVWELVADQEEVTGGPIDAAFDRMDGLSCRGWLRWPGEYG